MADQASEGYLSPWLREHRFNAARPYLEGRVLDFGSGSGGLAGLIPKDLYVGVERDDVSRQIAENSYPGYRFCPELIDALGLFDTVVALAVIEHLASPSGFIALLGSHLVKSSTSKIVLTTPHPAFDWGHCLGAKVGIFSHSAREEHQALLNRARLKALAEENNMTMTHYGRFLFGANQIAVFEPRR